MNWSFVIELAWGGPMKRVIFILISYFLVNVLLSIFEIDTAAASDLPVTASLTTQNSAASYPKFADSLSLQRTNSLFKQDRSQYIASIDLSNVLLYKWDSRTSTSVALDYSKDLMNTENSDFGKLQVSQKKSFEKIWNQNINANGKFNISLPVSKTDHNDHKIFSAGVGGEFTFPTLAEIVAGTNLILKAGVSRNFYQFDRRNDQTPLTAYSFNQGFDLSYDLPPRFFGPTTFTFSYLHLSNWNFQNEIKEFYTHSEEFAYQWSEKLSFAVGHSYGLPFVSPLKASGDRDYLQTWDANNSLVYMGLTINI